MNHELSSRHPGRGGGSGRHSEIGMHWQVGYIESMLGPLGMSVCDWGWGADHGGCSGSQKP